jgi:hypothetical protein
MSNRTDSLKHLMSVYGGTRSEQFLTAMATIEMVRPWYDWYQGKRQTHEYRDIYTLTVEGYDAAFPDLNKWVIDNLPSVDRKSMIVRTSIREPHIMLKYNGERSQEIYVEGHCIGVSLNSTASKLQPVRHGKNLLPIEDSGPGLQEEKMVFTCASIEAREAVIRLIENFVKPDLIPFDDCTPDLFMPARGNFVDWHYRGDLPARSLESVVLKDNQLERICTDIQHFLDTEERYHRLCMPYHRGYLFHGPSGTGKTSAARALADEFNLPVYYLPLGDVEKDANLTDLISQVPGKSVLLLEDIDSYHVSTDRDQTAGKPSIASLLNSLDGIWTPHGLITIMTTNHVEKLDTALIRAGRIGLSEEFSVMDLDQVQRMCTYLEYTPEDQAAYVGTSPADLMEAAARDTFHLIEMPS